MIPEEVFSIPKPRCITPPRAVFGPSMDLSGVSSLTIFGCERIRTKKDKRGFPCWRPACRGFRPGFRPGANEGHRSRTVTALIDLDDASISCWLGHPQCYYIPSRLNGDCSLSGGWVLKYLSCFGQVHMRVLSPVGVSDAESPDCKLQDFRPNGSTDRRASAAQRYRKGIIGSEEQVGKVEKSERVSPCPRLA